MGEDCCSPVSVRLGGSSPWLIKGTDGLKTNVRLALKNKKTNLPFPLHYCVSWDRLYLENRFEPNGSLEKFGSVPGLSVYYTNTFKNNSLAP